MIHKENCDNCGAAGTLGCPLRDRMPALHNGCPEWIDGEEGEWDEVREIMLEEGISGDELPWQ